MKTILSAIFAATLLLACSSADQPPASTAEPKQDEKASKSMFDMEPIPAEMEARLKRDYPNNDDYKAALAVLEQVQQDEPEMGWKELSWAMITLADGDLGELEDIVAQDYYGDPRHVLSKLAERGMDRETEDQVQNAKE